ncbi:MAG: fibronectin type III domain-containing protein [Candidatus Bipolaricaulaceae bacterium]
MRKGKVFLLVGLGLLLAGCGLLPEQPPLPPDRAPAGLQASFGAAKNAINLSWSAVERAEFYKIFRAESADGDFLEVGQTGATSYGDQVSEEGKWYWYKVRACNSAGCGPYSAAVRGYAGRPPKPEGLLASQGTFPDKIVISWAEIPGATHYQIFRDPSPQPGCLGLCLLADDVRTTSFEDRTAHVGVRYRYAIRACNAYGCSALSDQAIGCLNPCPPLFGHEE